MEKVKYHNKKWKNHKKEGRNNKQAHEQHVLLRGRREMRNEKIFANVKL